jgi:ArsR family metal-binding transcriptional regulator
MKDKIISLVSKGELSINQARKINNALNTQESLLTELAYAMNEAINATYDLQIELGNHFITHQRLHDISFGVKK